MQLQRKLITAALLLVTAAPSQAQTPQSPPIRVAVNRVNVGVTVTDSSGHFISGLRREDFHVFDNGVEQPVTDFLPIEEPAQLVLLIESGPAVLFLAKNHLFAADGLLTSISSADRVAIATYSRSPQLLLNFTPNKAEARAALQSINFGNGFADLNLASSLATTIDWLAPFSGKKTIVLLSTGFDTSPPENLQTIQNKLLTSDVRILAVSLTRSFPRRIAPTAPRSKKGLSRPIARCASFPGSPAAACISQRMLTSSAAPTPKSPSSFATNTALRSPRPLPTASSTPSKSKPSTPGIR